MYSDQILLAKIQAERNPKMADLEREHAIDLARAQRNKHTTNNTLGRFSYDQERERLAERIKRGRG